jgi:maltose alpha-D-glucosyltransferase/alpha-amylase
VAQWAQFVRNHDELTLDKLTKAEREEVFSKYAPDETMRIYGRGIRRRLPPMLNNDRRCLELVYSLLLTLPGTPVVRYGEEIGMGDDLTLPERESVRTPMQWSGEANGGFSSAPRERLVKPLVDGDEYGYERVNVTAQQFDADSLLNWMERAIHTRRQCAEFGYGTFTVLDTDDPAVLAHRCDWEGGAVLALHNLAHREAGIKLALNDGEKLVDLLGDQPYPALNGTDRVVLNAYGYRWFRVTRG